MKKIQLPKEIEQKLDLFRTMAFSEIPEVPTVGSWYKFTPPNCVSAQGGPYHATVRIGSTNNLAVVFCGGGVSLDEYTAARPNNFYRFDKTEKFYSDQVDFLTDALSRHGLGNDDENNPFKDWSIVVIAYGSGDFHCGAGDFQYVDEDGNNAVLHHHGYINFTAVMKKIKTMIAKPDKLLIAGFSAGAFGVSLLSDDIVDMFPDCKNVTCCVDSAMLLYDNWKYVAKNVWCAPQKISDRLQGNNITLDSLSALYRKRGDSVKYLFMSSHRDIELSRFQSFIDTGHFTVSKEDGDKYAENLLKMCEELQSYIPNIGIFIFDGRLPENVAPANSGLTEHCVIMSDKFSTKESDGITVQNWLWECVNGKISSRGLALLNRGY